ncbi:GDP dissociation inhibitor (macronuclear) [Tetrahymena thermophila SB210]|uniref:GDP dissociation inhibitor n=1 Tax=Tetrahymena thermophila (strain SB210) TaxID=312017 RepID=I7LXB9_TETTS|nr:GDP dissociation inhibitor [Tetrahymena thermophila SB210]EAS04334.1 GDP dissociation inhibitor [Tetrahymena thermophila SB210]|eukprot:XP_001024579.1 GDP dissociation inhibitor [Tetrahymena thermophila SB210]
MKKLEYTIDQKEYDTLVLGTGMTEALFSASLAKIDRKKILVVDADQGYSSSQKTFNFKELVQDMQDKMKHVEENKLKKEFFTNLELNEEWNKRNQEFVEEIVNKTQQYKYFNIDLQPKLLYSNSLVVDCMRQANMDQYMDFRAIDSIYFFEPSSKKFIQTPCSKSDIFKSKEFGLMEKKQLFQFLHKCVSLYNKQFQKQVNQNSIEEFDKEFEVDEETYKLYNQLKEQPCINFLRERISSKKVQDIFLYNLCNYEFNPNEPIPEFLKQDYTTKSFLHRLNKYIKSCGVHTALPYLYTNYGTGDIPQGFARISAIFGSIYCLNKDLDIQYIKKDNETGLFKIKSNLQSQPDEIVSENAQTDGYIYPKNEEKPTEIPQAEKQDQEVSLEKAIDQKQEDNQIEQADQNTKIAEENYFTVQNIIAGPEYRQKIKKILGLEEKQVKEDIYLLRVTIISKKSDEQVKLEKEIQDLEDEEKTKREIRYTCPIMYSIPPNDLLAFKQPLSILHLDHNSMSTPTTHQVFYCKKVLENKDNYNKEVEQIIQFVENIDQYIKGQPFKYKADYVWAYLQNRNDQGVFEQIQDEDKKFQVSFIGQDYFEIDMDKNFEEFRDTITSISSQVNTQDENYFQTIQELNGEVDFYQNKIEEEEDFKGIDNIINKFEQLVQGNNKQESEVKEGEVEQQKEQVYAEQKEIPQSENSKNQEENNDQQSEQGQNIVQQSQNVAENVPQDEQSN